MQLGIHELLEELRVLIAALGDDGGLVSPSVYDTAQVLRFAPPAAGVAPGLDWLLAQQHADGGWGEPTAPPARDVSTLAAVLALATYRQDEIASAAVRRGLDYLQQHARQWDGVHMDAIPIAAEMILPHLLDDAKLLGLSIDPAPYARLFALRNKKLAYLAHKPIACNSAPTYSWEALGFPHQSDVLDPRSGVGHSPAATAAWLQSARAAGETPARIAQAEDYLARAQASTQTGVPGVAPVAYPVTGFEYVYGLYGLLLTELLDDPRLKTEVDRVLDQTEAILHQNQGLDFGEDFVIDVDGTSVGISVLRAAGRNVNDSFVRRFWHGDHFYTFANELNPSVYSNAHALHALTLCETRCPLTEAFLIARQESTGGWIADKWHTSWRSTTLEVVLALRSLGYTEQLRRTAQALTQDQRPDGSWGTPSQASYIESVYAVMTLRLLDDTEGLSAAAERALQRGIDWLLNHGHLRHGVEVRWLGKDVYSPVRVDRIYQIATLCRLMMDRQDAQLTKTLNTELEMA